MQGSKETKEKAYAILQTWHSAEQVMPMKLTVVFLWQKNIVWSANFYRLTNKSCIIFSPQSQVGSNVILTHFCM